MSSVAHTHARLVWKRKKPKGNGRIPSGPLSLFRPVCACAVPFRSSLGLFEPFFPLFWFAHSTSGPALSRPCARARKHCNKQESCSVQKDIWRECRTRPTATGRDGQDKKKDKKQKERARRRAQWAKPSFFFKKNLGPFFCPAKTSKIDISLFAHVCLSHRILIFFMFFLICAKRLMMAGGKRGEPPPCPLLAARQMVLWDAKTDNLFPLRLRISGCDFMVPRRRRSVACGLATRTTTRLPSVHDPL